MLEKAFNDVYTKFKLHFYQNVFQRFATREATLTTVESFCMEGIMAMGEPTIAEFSRMMQISTPNAAYKIGSLVRKGYVEKIQSTTDRREYHLRPTQKYIDYYNISYSYLSTVVQRVNKRFPKEDVKKLEQMLTIISNELMPELNLENNPEAPEEKTYTHAAETGATQVLDLQLYSERAILIDADTNTVIAEKNPDDRIFPASMTKVMTALVACEQIENWDDTFTMTQAIIDPLYLADASLAGFVDGEKVPLLDLVYGAILPSGAEATEALSIYVAGSEEAYAELMNEKAAALGLTDTHFVDASGLHDEQHYTTLRDMAIILQAAMDNEICREILSTTYYTCQPTEQHPDGLKIFNKFLSRVEYQDLKGGEIQGAKTGYTAQAMNCCASFGVSPKGRNLICVTSKAWTGDFCIDDHVALYSQYADAAN